MSRQAVCPICGPLTGLTTLSVAVRCREAHVRSRGQAHMAVIEVSGCGALRCTSLVCHPIPRSEAVR